MRAQQIVLGVVLSAVVVIVYFGFLIFAASQPGLLTQPVIGAVPLSFVLAAALIVGAILLTGLYVLVANAAEVRR
jgi:uncharacterized membrane protein (DUF485 family)